MRRRHCRISGENKFYGTPINPYLPSSIPGGSSSGSAVAVAARLVDFAIGEFSLLACQVIFHLKMLFSQFVYVFSLISLPIQCNKQSSIYFGLDIGIVLVLKCIPGKWKVFVCVYYLVLYSCEIVFSMLTLIKSSVPWLWGYTNYIWIVAFTISGFQLVVYYCDLIHVLLQHGLLCIVCHCLIHI